MLVESLKDLRDMWKQGTPTFGPFVGLNAPGICEILGHAGFDYCIIDLEHGAIDLETAENMVRGANAAGIAPIIRVAVNREELISQALDLGAAGVHVPTISTAEEAQEAVWAAKFSPLGRRGVDPAVRAARYSADRGIFFEKANRETLVVTAIEGTEGIKNLPEILQVKGMDVLFVGPYDLSQSLGVIGQVRHPKVIEKIQEIVTLSKKSGVAVGLYTDTPEIAREWVKQGILYCCLGIDSAILYNASKDLVKQVHPETTTQQTKT
jgi:4-hydroxy-2-oxoheptanedioate aldolase